MKLHHSQEANCCAPKLWSKLVKTQQRFSRNSQIWYGLITLNSSSQILRCFSYTFFPAINFLTGPFEGPGALLWHLSAGSWKKLFRCSVAFVLETTLRILNNWGLSTLRSASRSFQSEKLESEQVFILPFYASSFVDLFLKGAPSSNFDVADSPIALSSRFRRVMMETFSGAWLSPETHRYVICVWDTFLSNRRNE